MIAKKNNHNKKSEIGIVSYEEFTFAEDKPLHLENDAFLSSITVRYETYGELNEAKSNAILIEHALSGNHHAAGKYSKTDKKTGWWHSMIGPGKAFDTNQYFVICTNCLGGCSGTTGPKSINPQTGKPYALNFPIITIGDMVAAEVELIKHLKIKKIFAIAGASMGGMKALHWSIYYPKQVQNVIIIASTAAQGSQSIAFSEVARQSIMRDVNWKNGNYYDSNLPIAGLSVARMLNHITYLSNNSMRKKFGRRLQNKDNLDFTFDIEFQIESYLRHQGSNFTEHFDANSYLYISKALNYFDLNKNFKPLTKAFLKARSRYLVMSFTSDFLYPSEMNKELIDSMLTAGREGSYVEIETDAGHDAFLIEVQKQTAYIKAFLDSDFKKLTSRKPHNTKVINSTQKINRKDFEVIESILAFIKKKNIHLKKSLKILDLGAGDGKFLQYLDEKNHLTAKQAIEIKREQVLKCLQHGIPVYHSSILEGLNIYPKHFFDVVLLSRTVQEILKPKEVISEMLRIGKKAIVSFINYGYYKNRWHFLLKGTKPKNEALPIEWYNSPDIHELSIGDFEAFCKTHRIVIEKKIFLQGDWQRKNYLFPNTMAGYAIYLISNK